MIKREPKPKTIIPCVVLFILSILVFCFMAAPIYTVDNIQILDKKDSYNFYEFFTIMNFNNIDGDIEIYDGPEITNINYEKKVVEYYDKQLKEIGSIDADEEVVFNITYLKKQANLNVVFYNIALSLFVVNTLLLLVSLLGICLAAFNDTVGLGLKYASFGLLVIIFLIVIVASGFISNFIPDFLRDNYINGTTMKFMNVSPALILSFVLFGLIAAGASEGFAFFKQKKENKTETPVTEKATIVEDIVELPEDNATPTEQTVDHGVIEESEDTVDDVKPVNID